MCQRRAAGTLWLKCGHFQRHMITAIYDCMSVNCEHSYIHPKHCQSRACISMYGPDVQDVIDRVEDRCLQCQWQEQKALQDQQKAAQAQEKS
ncbi:hypothetical protein AGABI1DRAFT_116351 [Agaricus bisporus var. burnettii JB137-S8]|uniref:Uncharacterized protein n=2 Tax=Agaricus bisporus var. burnettii TaxID=192524 RepID=K5WY37_AGABU|nr:hypothetical protein AGABI2DRAFT_196245 [Agaricus bisporus var. bisporus H97]XP_007333863.1 uncharacterized protein AGABI1DRAFT_116351 [Agaricus bisporus var. burnettii JB137-S8]EKM75517.1 hypothetical protein AGABI1DRAFT_116351 [Agaricus bisporus var. burnettii JB137-S8]EKV41633.1 hypothetical protein AGABI2DRAFT_196245 [Agaricus bisporus var. bisporus H97]KAF7767875.1 hypothetical protein Agabi119p4_7118 [Agaricus bisporus var. burnettii]